VVGQPLDRAGNPDGRIVVARHGAVSARAGGGQLDRDITFLANADHGDRRVHAADNAVEHGKAFVETKSDVRPALLEQGGHRLRAFSAAFLVMAEGEVDRLFRPVAARKQSLGGFQDRHQRALVVDRAASDHEAIGDRAGEWRSAPLALASSLDRHDILMGHQQQGRGGGIRSLPGEEQAPPRQFLALQQRVDAGEALFEKGVEGSKNLRRRRSGFGRNRLCLQSLREPLNSCGIDR
jgi:hypothetical protein